MRNPRRQFGFSIKQSASETDYVPGRTRDEDRAAMFEGRPGIVIPWQQKIGSIAMLETFDLISSYEGKDYSLSDTEELAGLFAVVSFGSAYHAFAENPQDDVTRRHGRLPDMLDRDTKLPIGYDGLRDVAHSGLVSVASLAADIEEMVHDGETSRRLDTSNRRIGRAMLDNALTFAAIERSIAFASGSESEMQSAAMQAAQDSQQRAIDLTEALGTRPSVAQLVDPSSPWMRYVYDNMDVASGRVFAELSEQIRIAASENTRTS